MTAQDTHKQALKNLENAGKTTQQAIDELGQFFPAYNIATGLAEIAQTYNTGNITLPDALAQGAVLVATSVAGKRVAGALTPNRLAEDLLRPGGNLLGSVAKGATENIRTVSSAEFSNLQSQLMKLGGTQVQKPTYMGVWYELPGGGGFGVRQAKSGPTLAFDLPGFPKGFKVHQQ